MRRRRVISAWLLLIVSLLSACGDAKRTASPPKAAAASDRPAPSVLVGARGTTTDATTTAPAVNWVLPIFTDREGYRSMTLRGSTVRPGAGSSIAVDDLNITIFSAQADPKVDSILLSPSARFFPKENRASGDKSVRFIRDTIEVTGSEWNYDHAAKKVSINRDVRVTFSNQLNDILK
ncbi:MAG: hypothetical protein Q7S40_12570 [Opitutaceae bacterium]|nr:hypothetical protein [Opitutaceae bacterium]